MEGDTHNVYVLMGDGGIHEGQVWEAAMYAGAKHINNLTAIIDWNNQQIDGSCDEVLSLGNYSGKWESFGWEVVTIDGHNVSEIVDTLESNRNRVSDKPLMILMKTERGKGVDFMCGTNAGPGKSPSQPQ